jgi:succinate dehydrogenase / fumarate reductase, cytochrome b subunit
MHHEKLTCPKAAGNNKQPVETARCALPNERHFIMTTRNRPLSPHLQVYKPQITSIMSITHRMTGVILCFGAVLLTYLLMAASYGPEVFATAQSILGSWVGKLVLLGVVFSLWYHLANGLRHIAWDIGWGFEMEQLKKSGIAVLVVSSILTIATFLLAYSVGG